MFGRWFPALVVGTLGLLSIAAGLSVVIKEWAVPTLNSRPHDPAVAPDGSLWYTGQLSNTLGRLEPATGAIKEFPLRAPHSGPHGLVADQDGNIWYTANFAGYIGKLNPSSGEITEFPLPDPKARDPHSLVFDQGGTLWFTVQVGNLVGRLDPKTGTVTLRAVPTPNSRPYGIAVNSHGVPFFCEFGTNKVARIHPRTMGITEYELPAGARPRRLAIPPDDRVYYTDFARGYLGRLDPESGHVDEWPSPGGPTAAPYGIAATPDGLVWYSESGVAPNTLVRFDPHTQTFATWPIPSGGGVVRHMVATPAGKLYLAESGVNKVAIAEVRR